jgi:hypothetical protein
MPRPEIIHTDPAADCEACRKETAQRLAEAPDDPVAACEQCGHVHARGKNKRRVRQITIEREAPSAPSVDALDDLVTNVTVRLLYIGTIANALYHYHHPYAKTHVRAADYGPHRVFWEAAEAVGTALDKISARLRSDA